MKQIELELMTGFLQTMKKIADGNNQKSKFFQLSAGVVINLNCVSAIIPVCIKNLDLTNAAIEKYKLYKPFPKLERVECDMWQEAQDEVDNDPENKFIGPGTNPAYYMVVEGEFEYKPKFIADEDGVLSKFDAKEYLSDRLDEIVYYKVYMSGSQPIMSFEATIEDYNKIMALIG